MKSFQDIEDEAKVLRKDAKAKRDPKDRIAVFIKGDASVEIPSLDILAKGFRDRLGRVVQRDDWRRTWLTKVKPAAKVLGDSYGIMGGAHRRLNEIELAIEAYDNGFSFEGETAFSIPDSYNRVQRLVNRILYTDKPVAVADDFAAIEFPYRAGIVAELIAGGENHSATGGMSTVLNELRLAEDAINEMLNVTMIARGDPWREADLCLVQLLLGNTEEATTLWSKIPRKQTIVFESTRPVINELEKKLRDAGDMCIKSQLRRSSEFLSTLISQK